MAESAENVETMSDTQLVRRAIHRDPFAIKTITSRNNQRLFRAAWSVMGNHADAEDVVQDAYLKAFSKMTTYEGNSSLSTWLTRIVINTALDRKRGNLKHQADLLSQDVALLDDYRARYTQSDGYSPESDMVRAEMSQLLLQAVSKLPEELRSVFVLRDIEELSLKETAVVLSVKEATVKTRQFRARRKLRKLLETDVKSVFIDTLPFAGADCEAMTSRVLDALHLSL
ncbi:MAG: RNA polymerase sigma factor [bacterium]